MEEYIHTCIYLRVPFTLLSNPQPPKGNVNGDWTCRCTYTTYNWVDVLLACSTLMYTTYRAC